MPTVRAKPEAAQALSWRISPLELLAAWPARAPLACLLSGGTRGPRARWSIFASPTETIIVDARSAGDDPLAALDRSPTTAATDLPFAGGWIGMLSYELGRVLEPRACASPASSASHPLAALHRCPGAFIHDRREDAWFVVGDESSLPEIEPRAAAGSNGLIEVVRAPASAMGRERFEAAVARTVEYIRAGDVFQANIAHHLRAAVRGEPRAVAARLLGAAGPWYGAYLELPDGRAIASASPELFLDYDPRTRRVMTRPIKGTSPATGREAKDALKYSEKDRAELTMIVDLMRNDLGRVCEFGSVAVDDPRAIERHGSGAPDHAEPSAMHPDGVYHGVATVSGTLRAGLNPADLLRATFPPGSVTGAPKIRAMQIIDELERSPRGPYCGAVGFLSDCGRSAWNVAIRTAMLSAPASSAGELDVVYPVGAGIVADSDPAREWEETMHKAGALMAVLAPQGSRPSRSTMRP